VHRTQLSDVRSLPSHSTPPPWGAWTREAGEKLRARGLDLDDSLWHCIRLLCIKATKRCVE
jgi:hypothetical protein